MDAEERLSVLTVKDVGTVMPGGGGMGGLHSVKGLFFHVVMFLQGAGGDSFVRGGS